MGHYEMKAHFRTPKKGNVLIFYSSWEYNQFRIAIVNKLELPNHYS